MRLFGLNIGFKKKKAAPVIALVEPSLQPGPSKQRQEDQLLPVITKIPRLKNPVLAFKPRAGVTGDFEQPEYDLAEIGRIADTEAYVRRAFRLKTGLMFKEGYEFTGRNLKTIQYVKERLRQLEQASGTPVKLLTRGIGEDLIYFSNAYLVKVRNVDASGGKVRQGPTGAAIKPIAAYFPIPPSTIRFKRDDNGKILQYRQLTPTGTYVEFNPDNVIHFYIDRKKGFLVGTPSLIPVKDDIRALRRIEENVEMLVYQHLFPLFHYTVGTETAPCETYPDGTTEVDVVKTTLEIVPAEGAIVTPERHVIKSIGAEGRAIRAEGYLTHFKNRVFSGLGVSAVDMGEGATANRATADNMSRNLVDDVKAMQRELEVFVNEYIIKELLLESTFPNPLSDENIVEMRFREIDLDAQIKMENHGINLFSGHGITHSEFRRQLGREPLSEGEWDDTFWKRIELNKLLIQAIDEPYTQEAKGIARANANPVPKMILPPAGQANPTKPPKSSRTSGQRAAGGKDQPSNQHGKKLSPEKRKSSLDQLILTDAANNAVTSLFSDLEKDISDAALKGKLDSGWLKVQAKAAQQLMVEKLLVRTRLSFRDGYRSTGAIPDSETLAYPLAALEDRAKHYCEKLIDDVVSSLESIGSDRPLLDKLNRISSVFDSLRYRGEFIYNAETVKAKWYGVALGYKRLGYKYVDIHVTTGACEDCRKQAKQLSLEHVHIDDVPAFHAACQCGLEILHHDK
jgi:hypothetical protein